MIDVIDCARFGGTGGQVVESCHNYCGSLDDFVSPSGGGVCSKILRRFGHLFKGPAVNFEVAWSVERAFLVLKRIS